MKKVSKRTDVDSFQKTRRKAEKRKIKQYKNQYKNWSCDA